MKSDIKGLWLAAKKTKKKNNLFSDPLISLEFSI